MAVRAAFALHLYTQPRTPFCRCAAFLHGKACHWIRGSLRSPMNPVPLPPSRGNKRWCHFPLRPLEGERATKWRGGAVRQEPQMTLPHRKAAVWWCRASFWSICPSANDCMLPAAIVISSGGTCRYHAFLHSPFVFKTDGETVPFFIGLYQQRGEKAGPKSFLCRSAQSMEAEREGQKPS